MAIILHNFIIDVEGDSSASHFISDHSHEPEFEDRGSQHELLDDEEDNGVANRKELVAELVAFKSLDNYS